MSRPWLNMSVTNLISVLIPLVALQCQVISTEDCSTSCEWTSWNPWGSCSVTCGGGHRSRDRQLCCDRDHDVNQCLAACGLTSSGFDDSSTCSENCVHGSYSSGHCQCGLSYYGSCCQHTFPCEPLVAPDNGAVACNGWNGRFGEVCTVLCQETRDLSPGEDISRLYVCGASGKWSLKMDIGACSEPYIDDGQSDDVKRHYYSGNCDDQRLEIGEKYIEILKASDMREMCTSWAKAKVVCGNNTAS